MQPPTIFFFFFNDTATTEIYTRPYTLSLHDALPISVRAERRARLPHRDAIPRRDPRRRRQPPCARIIHSVSRPRAANRCPAASQWYDRALRSLTACAYCSSLQRSSRLSAPTPLGRLIAGWIRTVGCTTRKRPRHRTQETYNERVFAGAEWMSPICRTPRRWRRRTFP